MLSFEGLNYPNGVVADKDGNVFVADHQNHRVLKLAAGSETQTVLPFPPSVPESDWTTVPTEKDGLRLPAAVAVDKVGNLYVTDCYWPLRVWKLPAGSNAPFVLVTGFGWEGLAVDTDGNLYGTAPGPGRVWKLDAPTMPNVAPTVLPITGLQSPPGVAVDSAGNLYVVDAKVRDVPDHRVVKVSADFATQTVLPFTGLNYPFGIAVDSAGAIYVTDGAVPPGITDDPGVISRVLKLAPGSNTPTVLPFEGLKNAAYVAVRPIWTTENPDVVYLSDTENNRVLRLGLGKPT